MVPLPNPSRKGNPICHAPGGKSKSSLGLRWVAPVTMTHAAVSSIPIQSTSIRRAMSWIFLYSASMAAAVIAAASNFTPQR